MSITIYLASPYFNPDPAVREARVAKTSALAAKLMEAGYIVFSPITQGHAIAEHLSADLAHSHDFWMRQSLRMLSICDWLIINPLEGWEESKGIAEEMKFARLTKIPTYVWAEHTEGGILMDFSKNPQREPS